MKLLNIIKTNLSTLIIGILVFLSIIPAIPLINTGLSGVFYNMDPEMALIGNSLSFVESGNIYYKDHPGTPTIVLISLATLPLRIYTGFIEGKGFTSWSFDNLRSLFLYIRIFYVILFLVSILVYLCAIKILTRDIFVIIFSWLLLFTFSFTPKLAGTVLTETFSFLLISIWLYIFVLYMDRKEQNKISLLSFIGGLSIANKYNSFPLLLFPLAIVVFSNKISIRTIFKKLVLTIGFGVGGLLTGLWPVKESLIALFRQIVEVFFQSGSAHGSNNSIFIDPTLYLNGLISVYNIEKVPATAFVTISILVIVFVIYKSKVRVKINRFIYVIFGTTFLSTLFIAKYPTSYYQFPNFIIISFIASYFVNKTSKFIVILLSMIIFVSFYKNMHINKQYLTNSINKSEFLENYLNMNHTDKPTLWDYGMSEDFMKLWIRDYSEGVFDLELRENRPDLLVLKSDYRTVNTSFNVNKNIFDTCWGKLYIRENRLMTFQELYKTRKFEYFPIGDTGIWKITSNHCI